MPVACIMGAMNPLTYKSAGLDLDLYDDAMGRLPPLMKRTHSSRVIDLADGFAGLFRLSDHAEGGKPRYRDPVLVSGTDGVGTKLKVATLAQKFDTVGIDLVAMCVNDCLCLGAEPLFFLDYLALPKDDPAKIAALVKGVSDGCVDAGASLMGGETAIMPDVYAADEFDMAGFCVGVVERDRIIDGKAVQPGDVVIGLPSSGFHSNGYSLVRKVVFDRGGLSLDSHVTELGRTVRDVLLEPTKIYVRAIRPLLADDALRPGIHALAHITGGGLKDNIERLLPEGVVVRIDRSTWSPPACFGWLASLGPVEREEMFRVFNMGIGFVVICAPETAGEVQRCLPEGRVIGGVSAGPRSVELVG